MRFDTIEELIEYYHYNSEIVTVIDKNGERTVEISKLKSSRVFSHSFENQMLVIIQY